MKKLRAFVITIPLLLLMAEKAQALPMPELMSGKYESRARKGETAPPAANKTDLARTPSKAKTANRKKGRALARKRSHRSARTDWHHARRKSAPNMAAALAKKRYNDMYREYVRKTHKPWVATSFDRTELQQAHAIHGLIRRHGVNYVLNLYRNGSNIKEIVAAYLQNRRSPKQAQREMTRVIEAQVAEGRFVSKHLRGLAVDIRSHGRGAARLSALRAAARKVGARVLVEPECYHVSLV